MSLRIRRGGYAEFVEPPPDDPSFGPTMGWVWVKEHAGPRTVVKPTGATDVAVGSLTQTLLNNATTPLWVLAGTHNIGLLYPKANQLIAFQPGAILDGNGAPTGMSRNATYTNTNVTIRGGYWTDFGVAGANPSHRAISVGTGWTVEDAEFAYNAQSGLGVYPSFSNVTLRNCSFHDNGRYGFSVGGDAASENSNWLVEYCQVYHNNTGHYDVGADAGGVKTVRNSNSTWRYNHFWDNYGMDLWPDSYNHDNTYEESVFEKNFSSAWFVPSTLFNSSFHCEDSWGGTFQRNYVRVTDPTNVCGGDLTYAAVITQGCDAENAASTKKTFEVTKNIIDSDGVQMYAIWQQAGRSIPRGHQFHDNQLFMRMASNHTFRVRVGGVIGNDDPRDPDMYEASCNNRFYANEYHVTDDTLTWWAWERPSPQVARTWAQWQAYGHDLAGTLTEAM